MSDHPLLCEADAAQFLGVSRGFLRVARMKQRRDPEFDGAPPFCDIGARCVRYRLADLEAWLDSRVVGCSR